MKNSPLIHNYTMRTDRIKDEDGKTHTVYGVNLYVGNTLVKTVPDIFLCPETIKEFTFLCNKLNLNEESLYYLIDFVLGRIF